MLYRNLIKSLYSDLFRTRIHGFLAVYMRANLSSLVFKSAPIPFQFSYLPFLGCAVDVFYTYSETRCFSISFLLF